ncbi:MAG: hypothetical protein FWB86_05585 [Treponema sp.]|nr:hypothetical protein [Treponema sp.]MCL2250523.1 hypothetical protein [Treponema sp.]
MKGFFNRYRIFSFIFFIFLISPAVTYPILKNILSTEKDGLNENRSMNEFEFSIQNFGTNFDNYYQDNFPFRSSLIPLYNKYYNIIYSKYFAENTDISVSDEPFAENANIIEWKWDIIEEPEISRWDIEQTNFAEEFVKNELVIAEEPVLIELREENTDKFKRLIDRLVYVNNYFNSLNKKIIFQACPRKDYVTGRVSRTELDFLSSYIDHNTNLSFSYPKNEYLAFPSDYMIYDEYTGHHNFLGAYISWQEIQKKAGIATTDINNLVITEFEIDIRRTVLIPYLRNSCYTYNQDLPALRKTEYIKSINYNVAYKPEIEVEVIQNYDCYRMEFKSNNKNGQTVFVTGDSFLESQIQYAVKDFEFSYFSHLYNLDAGSRNREYRNHIKRYIENADVIVIVFGENNIFSNDLEHNPGLEIRLAFLLELAEEIYR